jgi:DNA-binding phage protein
MCRKETLTTTGAMPRHARQPMMPECMRKIDHAQLASFHAMQAVESTNIIRLARSMRLTHQTIYRADSTKHRPVLPAPWQRE